MIRTLTGTLCAAVILAGSCLTAHAQTSTAQNKETDPLAYYLVASQATVDAAKSKAERLRALYLAGSTTSAEVEAAEADYKVAQATYAQAKNHVEQEKKNRSLTQPVDVHLKESTVSQAADALSRVSSVPIEVDKSVPSDLRISVDARGIPLASVLEAVASQAGLQIGKSANGVVLRTWPRLEVNGSRTDYTGPNAPWSDEWGLPGSWPLSSFTTGQRWHGLFGKGVDGNVLTYGSATKSLLGTLNGYRASGQGLTSNPTNGWVAQTNPTSAANRSLSTTYSTPAASTLLNISGVGEHIVIAEAGTGPKGQAGYWLTVYRLSGSELTKVASTFHTSPAAARRSSAGYRNLFYSTPATTTGSAYYGSRNSTSTRTRPSKP